MFSKKAQNLRPSPTVAMNMKAQSLREKGETVLNLTVGEPHFPTPKAIIDETCQSLKAHDTRYGKPGGGKPVREAVVAKLLKENQLSYEPDEVVIGIGAKQIIFHSFLALLDPGDEVLVPSPYWGSYPEQAMLAGGSMKAFGPESGVGFSLDQLKRALTDRSKALLLTSPHNPTGQMLSKEQLEAIARVCREHGLFVISDEIYEYYSYDKPHISILNVCPDLRDQVLLINGLSKGSAMTGFRFGYGVGAKPLIAKLRAIQTHATTCHAPFIEKAAIKALTMGKEAVLDHVLEMKRLRDLCASLLHGVCGIKMPPPEGAFYFFIDLRPFLGQSSSQSFCEALLLNKSVALVPGEAFGAPGFARLSYAVPEAVLKEAIHRLQEFLEKGSKE